MPRISRVVAIGPPHYPTQRGNYQECVSEDKDGLRQRLRSPRREVKNPSEQLVLSATFNFFQRKAEKLYR